MEARPESKQQTDILDLPPMAEALVHLLRLMDVATTPESILAGLPVAGERITLENCAQAAGRLGLNARIVHRPKLEQISPLALPAMIELREGACVLLPGSDEKANVMLPETGDLVSELDWAELGERSTGYVLFVRQAFAFDQRAEDVELVERKNWFWGTLLEFRGIYKHVIVASLLINVFAVATPLFIMNVYDRVLPNNATATLWVLFSGIVIVFAFEFVLRNARSYFMDLAGRNADVLMSSALYRKILDMRLDHKPRSTGSMANNIREFEALRDFMSSTTLVAFADLPFIFVFIGVIWMIGGPLALIPLIAVPIVLLAGWLLQKPMLKTMEQSHRQASQRHANLVEAVSGVEAIKVANAQGQSQGKWEKLVDVAADSSRRSRGISSIAVSLASTVTQLATVSAVVAGVYMVSAGTLSVGGLIAVTILVGRTLAPLATIASVLTRLERSRVALEALDRLMKTETETSDTHQRLRRDRLSGDIAFKRVDFRYPGQTNNALNQVSIAIKAGEKVGVIGRSGSGKTTLGRLIMGLYEPQEGAVLVDRTDIRQIEPYDLRRNIGYVSQDNVLFFGSVRDNITLGVPNASSDNIIRVSNLSGVTDFVNESPAGFDHPVGERGLELSGGQRQAVAFARALLLDPPVLLLDEPTSGMDVSSEARLKRNLKEIIADRTMVLITHRFSMLDIVDRLIVLDRGRVVADGPKEDILDRLRQGAIRGSAVN